MKVKRQLIAITAALTVAIVLVSCPVLCANQQVRAVPAKGTPFGWELGGNTVMNQGKSADIREGTLVTGYTIHAEAMGIGHAPVKTGLFRLTLTAFSPKFDMPGQKAGVWYLRGEWTITDESADPKLRKVRHNPAVIRGTLSAKLPEDPRAYRGQVAAAVRVPRMADGAGLGQGTLQGDGLFEGTINLVLRR
jgi:hypothetical protein